MIDVVYFKFKNRCFAASLGSVMYFPGKLESNDSKIIVEGKDVVFLHREGEHKVELFPKIKLLLDIKEQAVEKRLTHKTSKKRKKHTYKKYQTFLTVSKC